MMLRSLGAAALLLLLVACATTPPEASGPIDWTAVADAGVPEIVTVDPDGDVRETKLWLVVVDGTGYIRTGETRWFHNIERDPDVVLRIGDAAYPLQAKLVMDPDLRARVNRAFGEKYGFQDRAIGWLASIGLYGARREDANILRLGPRPGRR